MRPDRFYLVAQACIAFARYYRARYRPGMARYVTDWATVAALTAHAMDHRPGGASK